MKLTLNDNINYIYGCQRQSQIGWFTSIIWAKLNQIKVYSNLNQSIAEGASIEGNIIRKSQFLGQWEFRKVKIDKTGLKSYK